MPARFFVDETDLALGKAMAVEHEGVVFPGHPDLPEVPRQTLDDVWLPVIGDRQLVVVTRDKRIRYRPVEKMAWVTNGVRGIVLTGRTSQSTIDSMAILNRHWVAIESLVDDGPDGPWMHALTAAGLREIHLG
jgi:PIN domain-containing protein